MAFKIAKSSAGIRGIGSQADFFTLSGAQSPGLAKLVSVGAAQSWDRRKAYGSNWETIVPMGETLSTVVFEVRIWVAEDSAAWDAFASTYLSRAVQSGAGTDATQVKALSFSHDAASAPPYSVAAVVVQNVEYLGQVEPGIIAHRVELLEWKQPQPAPVAPDTTTPASPNGPPPAKDATDAEQNDITSKIADREDKLALLRDR